MAHQLIIDGRVVKLALDLEALSVSLKKEIADLIEKERDREGEGQKRTHAIKRLEELGFKVKVQEENSPTVEAGRVIQQDVKSGNGKRGDTITITKSLGPVMVTIPEVRLKSTEEATKLLEDLDLKVEVRLSSDFPIALNIASGTDPAEGTSVPVGSTVVLFIA